MKMTATTKEFLEAIKTVEGSLLKGNDQATKNQIISNVCIKVKSYYLELVATDGTSLTMAQIVPQYDNTFDKNLINKEFIVPLDSIKKAIDNKSRVVTLDLMEDDNNKYKSIAIDNNNGSVSKIPCVTGCYPKYEQLMSYRDSYDQIKRENTIIVGMSRKLLLDILKSYDSKSDNVLKFEIKTTDNYSYIGIQPTGLNSGKKFTMLMPIIIR